MLIGEELPNLDQVPDPFVADPGTQEQAQESDLKAENALLKTQLEAAQKVQVVIQQPQQQQQQQMPQQTPEELQAQAEKLGFTDPKQIESIGQIAAHVAAPAYQKAMLLEQELKLERVMNKAKKEAQASDPQFSKLEPLVDEFMDGVSVQEKLDPEKLKGHMERAQFYAKGKMGVPSGQRRSQPPPQTPRGDDQQDQGGRSMNGPEVYNTVDGKIRLVVQPRVSDAIRKLHAHPTVEGGVQINPSDEWKAPTFAKDKKD